MKRKRNVKTSFLLWLRNIGWLCKKQIYRKPATLRIKHTVYPDGKPRMSPNGSGEWYGLVELQRKDK